MLSSLFSNTTWCNSDTVQCTTFSQNGERTTGTHNERNGVDFERGLAGHRQKIEKDRKKEEKRGEKRRGKEIKRHDKERIKSEERKKERKRRRTL